MEIIQDTMIKSMSYLEKNKANFDHNLNLLKRKDPELFQRLLHFVPSKQYHIIESKSGNVTLDLIGDKRHIALHSHTDPQKEAQREIESLASNDSLAYVFLGLGLGYALEALLTHYSLNISALLLIERDIEIFYLFLHRRQWDVILNNPSVQIMVSDKPELILPAAKSILPQIMSCGLRFIDHCPSNQLYKEFYAKTVDYLRSFLQRAVAESEFLVENGALIQRNALLNIPVICDSHGLGPLRDFYKNVPAVLMAAGPSLKRNIRQLAQYRSNIIFFCVDTAFPTAQQQNLHPDFVAATDPSTLNGKHFEGLSLPDDCVLIFESDVYPEIPRAWQGPKIFLNSEKAAINSWIENVAGPFGRFDQGLSVAHTLFTAASWMGCDPIILMGFDLAYDPDMGTTHAEGTKLNRKMKKIKTGDTHVQIEKSSFNTTPTSEELTWVLGVRGKPVPTSKPMAIFLQKLSEDIRHSRTRVFDATEGGALIEGSIPTQLGNILSSIEKPSVIPDIITFLKDNQDPQEQSWISAINSLIEGLKTASIEAQEGFKTAQSIRPCVNDSEIRSSEEWAKMDQHFWNLYRNEELQVVLEQALFPVIFIFIRRNKDETTEIRLNKYTHVFQAVLLQTEEFMPCLTEIRDQLS